MNSRTIKWHLGVPELSREAAFRVRFFALGNAGSIGPWLYGEVDATSEQFAANLFDCMPPMLRGAYTAQAGLQR